MAKSPKRGSGRASIGMELIDGDDLIATLKKLNAMVQNRVVDEALKAGIKPVEKEIRSVTPDSRKTGSRKKQSKKARDRFSGSKPLRTTIRSVVRKRSKGAIAMAGPSYNHGGGHGNFFASDHKRKVYWGRNAGGIRVVDRFVKRAADSSRASASAAIKSVLRAELDKAAKEASRG